jgi:hypothetical protein
MRMRDLRRFITAQATGIEIAELETLAFQLIQMRAGMRRISQPRKERIIAHLRGAAKAFGRGLCDQRRDRLNRCEYLLAAEAALRRAEFDADTK